jgi:hypothetical protein
MRKNLERFAYWQNHREIVREQRCIVALKLSESLRTIATCRRPLSTRAARQAAPPCYRSGVASRPRCSCTRSHPTMVCPDGPRKPHAPDSRRMPKWPAIPLAAVTPIENRTGGEKLLALTPRSTMAVPSRSRGFWIPRRAPRALLNQTSSHSLRTSGSASKSAGLPWNTMRPWPIT